MIVSVNVNGNEIAIGIATEIEIESCFQGIVRQSDHLQGFKENGSVRENDQDHANPGKDTIVITVIRLRTIINSEIENVIYRRETGRYRDIR